MSNINIDEIKQYNSTLKQYKDKAATLNAEIEYTSKELDTLCAELSQELGVTVTRDNIETVYNEQVDKINNTLQSGTAVLQKIANEEAVSNSQPTVLQQPQPVMTQPVMQQPVMTQPVVSQPETVQQNVGPVFSSQPTAGPVFGATPTNNGQLPPLFNI